MRRIAIWTTQNNFNSVGFHFNMITFVVFYLRIKSFALVDILFFFFTLTFISFLETHVSSKTDFIILLFFCPFFEHQVLLRRGMMGKLTLSVSASRILCHSDKGLILQLVIYRILLYTGYLLSTCKNSITLQFDEIQDAFIMRNYIINLVFYLLLQSVAEKIY